MAECLPLELRHYSKSILDELHSFKKMALPCQSYFSPHPIILGYYSLSQHMAVLLPTV